MQLEECHLSDEDRYNIRYTNKWSIGLGICSTLFCLNVFLGLPTVIIACQSNYYMNRGEMAKGKRMYMIAAWLTFSWFLVLGLGILTLIVAWLIASQLN